jgi:hypothetical protein
MSTMAITFACPACGRQLKVGDNGAGKRARCPECGAVAPLPTGPVTATLLEDDGVTAQPTQDDGVRCPECGREWPRETVVCVGCGYHFETGKRLKTVHRGAERTATFGIRFLGIYTRYKVRCRHDEISITKKSWLLFLPLGSSKTTLRSYEAVYTDYQGCGSGWSDERSESYTAEARGRNKPPVTIYRGPHEPTMKWLVDALQEVGGLEVKRT